MENLNKKAVYLLINDIHLGKDNVSEFRKNWSEAVKLAVERKVDAIVVGGDFWQSRVNQPLNVLLAAKSALREALEHTDVYLADGNHDKVDPESYDSYNSVFEDLEDSSGRRIYKINECLSLPIHSKQGCNALLHVMSYFPENGSFAERLSEIAKKIEEHADKRHILYCHQGINGALSSANDKELPVNIFKPFDKVLVGHYHNRAILDDGRIEYIGASRQHNFGEDGMKGYTVIFDDGSSEFILNEANIRYQTLEVDIEDLPAVTERLKQVESNTLTKVKVRCESEQASTVDKQSLIEAGAAKIELVTDSKISEAITQSLDAKFNKDGIMKEYSRFCIQKEITNVDLGLQYLAKIEGTCGN